MKSIKDLLFRMSAGQILASLIIVVSVLVFLSILFIPKPSTQSPLWFLIILSTIFLLSRLSVIVKVGIGFLPFILFGVLMGFGPVVCFIIIYVTTGIYCWIAIRPTPLDFAITKSVSSSVAQAVYLSLYTIALMLLFKVISIEYIMGNLIFTYMISIFIYVVFMVICLPILAQRPLPEAMINGLIMFPFQYILIRYLGMRFMTYMLSFAG